MPEENLEEIREDEERIREKLDFKLVINRHIDRIGRTSIGGDAGAYMVAIRTLEAFIKHRLLKEPEQVTLKEIEGKRKTAKNTALRKVGDWKLKAKYDPSFYTGQVEKMSHDKYMGFLTEQNIHASIEILELLMQFLDKEGLLFETGTEEDVV